MTAIFAHRGVSKECPENTMAAFQRAFEYGVDGIELDVQLTKDYVPVIIHDEKLKRTTDGKGFVNELTLKEIRKLDAGSWFSPDYKGERIPTLMEFLEWAAPKPLLINIELKNTIILYEGIEEIVYKMVSGFNLQNRTIFSSFNHYSLMFLKEIDPACEVAPLFSDGLFEPWKYAANMGACSAHPHYLSLHPAILKGYEEYDIRLRPYTVNKEKWLTYLLGWNLDSIITDQPQLALTLRSQKPKKQPLSFFQKMHQSLYK